MLSAIPWLLRRRVHTSYLIAYTCGGFICGVAAARYAAPAVFLSAAWPAVSLVLVAVCLWRQRYWAVPAVIFAGVMGGLWRGSILNVDVVQYAPLYGHTLTLSGTVRDDPDASTGTLVTKLTDIHIEGHGFGGTVWVSTSPHDVKRSDHVVVAGKLESGFGTFAGTMYRANVRSVTRAAAEDPARDVRDWFAGKIRQGIPEPESSLGIGYLVGQKSALPTDLAQAFVLTGLTQAIVASGYNLTILVRLARRLFVRMSRYLALAAAGAMVLAFMAVTGLTPSMTRAGIVSGLSLIAWYYGRTIHPLVLLPVAGTLTLLYNPSYAWGDLGWALSFSAFAAVMVLAPLLHAYFFGEGPPGLVRGLLVETIAATIVTLPILMFAFGQFSNVSLPASLLVLPLIPLAMLLTFIAGIGAAVFPGIAGWLGLPATWLLGYMVWVAKAFAGLDWTTSVLSMPPGMLVASYVLIAAACLYLWRATHAKLGQESLIL